MSFIGDSFGKLSKTGLGDLLFTRPGSNERIMPSQVVLSSKCFITFKLNGEKEYVAEFDQFTKTKRLTEKKNFKPYGFTRNISLIKDEGWDLAFSGKKTNPKMGALISLQEYLLNGETYSGFGDPVQANGVKLTFDIEEIITYRPDDKGVPSLVEIYTYKDSSIVAYSEETPADNQMATFNISFFCGKRELLFNDAKGVSPLKANIDKTSAESGYISKNITNMIDDILQQNKQ
jgi:hypothetical protein